MLIIISYIWPISSQNTEAIDMEKDLYDSALSCPEDKCPLMRAAVQSRRNSRTVSTGKKPREVQRIRDNQQRFCFYETGLKLRYLEQHIIKLK